MRIDVEETLTGIEEKITAARKDRAAEVAEIRNGIAELEEVNRAAALEVDNAADPVERSEKQKLKDLVKEALRRGYEKLNEALAQDEGKLFDPVEADEIASAAVSAYHRQDKACRDRCIELVKELYEETVKAEIVTTRVNRILKATGAGYAIETPFFIPWARKLVRDGRYTVISGEVSPEVSQEGAAQ